MSDQPANHSRRQLMFGGAIGALLASVPVLAQAKKTGAATPGPAGRPTLAALKELHDAYFKAFSAHDAAGVVALFTPNAIVVGTGPGEIWGGPEEIAEAHKNFFEAFDPGKQESEVLFRDGNVLGGMAWITSMSRVKFTKGADVTEFGLNSSVVFEKAGGKWLIRSMHFSNLTSGPVTANS